MQFIILATAADLPDPPNESMLPERLQIFWVIGLLTSKTLRVIDGLVNPGGAGGAEKGA